MSAFPQCLVPVGLLAVQAEHQVLAFRLGPARARVVADRLATVPAQEARLGRREPEIQQLTAIYCLFH